MKEVVVPNRSSLVQMKTESLADDPPDPFARIRTRSSVPSWDQSHRKGHQRPSILDVLPPNVVTVAPSSVASIRLILTERINQVRNLGAVIYFDFYFLSWLGLLSLCA